jgi:hypothetical protein
MEQSDDPAAMRPVLLQQRQHLLVGAPVTPGEMVHNHVLEVVVPHRDLVGITV